jgi:probable rRNA maturation factor
LRDEVEETLLFLHFCPMAIVLNQAPRKHFPARKPLLDCLKATAARYGKKIGDLNYIFVSDEALLEINQEFLEHDFYTDIITFDLSDVPEVLEGSIYISKDRVQENGLTLGAGIEEEYCRVLAHGLLHLCGLNDKTKAQAVKMRQAEEAFIRLYQQTLAGNPS